MLPSRLRPATLAHVALGWSIACGGAASSTKTAPATDTAIETGTSIPDATRWRSTLYPEDWSPGYRTEDGSLRDFSTAGYRAGEAPLPTPDLAGAISIVDHGADPTGTDDSTAAVEAALAAAAEHEGPLA